MNAGISGGRVLTYGAGPSALARFDRDVLMIPGLTHVILLEARRAAVNAFIRSSGEFDATIDFDMATRDPAAPLQFLPSYDSGDHLHPGDAGYRAMGDAIDLTLFRRQR